MWTVAKQKAYCSAYYKRNKEQQIAKARLKKFGCSATQFDSMLSKQRNRCASCRQPERVLVQGKPRALAVDHCHTSNKVRGLLCSACNMALGQLQDNPLRIKALLDYVEKSNV